MGCRPTGNALLIITLIVCVFLLAAGFDYGDKASRDAGREPRHGKSTISKTEIEELGTLILEGDDTLRLSIGCLQFIEKPDISLCFCGEYYLSADEPWKNFYLQADSIDFTPYIDKEILVVGRPFVRICEGTLARPCDYMDVHELSVVTEAGSIEVSWGLLKMIHRVD